jgi:hypothetical protein
MTNGSMASQWFFVAACRFGLSLKLRAPFHESGAYHTIQRVLKQVDIWEKSPLTKG